MRRRKQIKRTGKYVPPSPMTTAEAAPQAEPQPEESEAKPAGASKPEEQPEEASPSTSPEEQPEEQSTEPSEPPTEEAADIHGDMRFPLVSSHIHGDKVKTTGLLVSDHGCSLVHCDAMPRTLTVGVERVAPKIAGIHRAMLRKLGMQETQRKVAEAFCKRAREGDQNAMAMITMVGQNARKGIPQAVSAFKFMQDFIKNHPVTPASFGVENELCVKPDMHGAVHLANGPPLTSARIRKAASSFGEDTPVFLQGIRKWQSDHDKVHKDLSERLDSMQRDILRMGRTLGKARALQAIRSDAPLSMYSKTVAWELGE